MIRPLNAYEVPTLIAGAKMFFEEGKIPGGLRPEIFIKTWKDLIEEGTGVVLGLYGSSWEIQGALGAVVFPDPFNGDRVAIENFWYVIPQFRGRGALLLREFERWARKKGCQRISMVHLQRLQPNELKDFYQRLGYEHIESCYTKDLTASAEAKEETCLQSLAQSVAS